MAEVAKNCASQVFIPFTVGGGIRTVDDMREMLKAGADKISVNSAAVRSPDIILEGAKKFGSQCIVLAVDAKKKFDDEGWEIYINGGRVPTGIDCLEWVKKAVALGAGEILLTSMDADGTKDGYDIPLTRAVSEAVNVPVIASGGAGGVGDFVTLFKALPRVDAGLAASIFHFGEVAIDDLKKTLSENGILVRR